MTKYSAKLDIFSVKYQYIHIEIYRYRYLLHSWRQMSDLYTKYYDSKILYMPIVLHALIFFFLKLFLTGFYKIGSIYSYFSQFYIFFLKLFCLTIICNNNFQIYIVVLLHCSVTLPTKHFNTITSTIHCYFLPRIFLVHFLI